MAGGIGEEKISLVADANIIFACTIRNSLTRKILLEENILLYAPSFILEEFSKYEADLREKAAIDPALFNEVVRCLFERIQIIPQHIVAEFEAEAAAICPDPDDVPYFQVALYLGIPVWSNDRRLKKQRRVRIFTTEELAHLF